MAGGRGFGNYGCGDSVHAGARCATTDDLNAQCLGDIKAAVPLAEGQVQLALAGVQSALTAQANMNASQAAQTACNVDRQSMAIQQAIHADGEATRALITSNTIAELNQRLTVSQQEALELRQRNDRDRDRHGVEITMTNNQNQLQQQQQLQFQAINHQIAGLFGLISQRNYATNSTVQVGNTGAATAGPQNNNPTNVVA